MKSSHKERLISKFGSQDSSIHFDNVTATLVYAACLPALKSLICDGSSDTTG